MQGPIAEASGALDKYINLLDVWAVCGTGTMGTNSELEVGTYLKSDNGARLTLTSSGLKAVDSSGVTRWAPSGRGDRLILQEDQNLVLYSGSTPVWASGTNKSGAIWLSLRDDGTFALFDSSNNEVWSSGSHANPASYRGKMVQWDNDPSAQATAWQVGYDGNRRWVPNQSTFECLHDSGAGNSLSVSSDVLKLLPNLENVWAACGTDRIGLNGSLEQGTHLTAGSYSLTVTSSSLVIAKSGSTVWQSKATQGSSTGSTSGGAELRIQPDGNVVLYNNTGAPLWSTGTNGKRSAWLVLGSDGSLRLYDGSNNQIWSR